MNFSILHLVFLCISILISGIGCSRKQHPARDYDLNTADALIACGNLLLTQQNKLSADDRLQQLLSALGKEPRFSPLVANLQAHYDQLVLYKRGTEMLATQQYNDLDNLILQAEHQGKATPELLQLRGMRSALQALSLHCLRRPFTCSSDLRQSLDYLSPYNPFLQTSEVYQQFLDQEIKELHDMEKREHEENVQKYFRKLDWIIVSYGENSSQSSDEVQALHTLEPDLILFDYINFKNHSPKEKLLNFIKSAEKMEPQAENTVKEPYLEIACALAWKHFTESEKRIIQKIFAGSKTESSELFCGRVLHAAARRSCPELATCKEAWKLQADSLGKIKILPPFVSLHEKLKQEETKAKDDKNAPTKPKSGKSFFSLFADKAFGRRTSDGFKALPATKCLEELSTFALPKQIKEQQ